MIQSYLQLLDLVKNKVIENVDPANINGSSIDVRLGKTILVEHADSRRRTVRLRKRDRLDVVAVDITDGYVLEPGAFVLGHTMEVFNMPLDISAEFKMKSSMARMGLNHLTACWIDPGWHGSHLTLELKNELQRHSIQVQAGDSIGQIVFFRHAPVPLKNSYAARGRYNKDEGVSQVKK